jgi:hypothetical protein
MKKHRQGGSRLEYVTRAGLEKEKISPSAAGGFRLP